MKTPIKITVIMAIVFQFLLSATTIAAGVTDGQVFGTWKYSSADGENKRTLEFFPDHTSEEHALLAYAYAVSKGKWKISNGKIWVKGYMDSAVMSKTNQAEYEAVYELMKDGKLKWAKGDKFILYERSQ